MGIEVQRVVDNTFDEMHKQSRLQYTMDPTSFNFSVFVIYKTDHQDKRNGQAVIDIRKLNKLVLPDAYSLLLQSEIIANVQGCTNLAILDVVLFSHQ